MLFLLLALVLVGIRVALRTEPFTPHPSLVRRRVLVAAMASIASGMLVLSVRYDWWVMHDWESELTDVGRADSPAAMGIVVAGLASALATVAAAWGRRNWAVLPLSVGWFLIASTFVVETGNGDAGGGALSGLELAAWAMLILTLATVFGSFGRIAERRADAAGHPLR